MKKKVYRRKTIFRNRRTFRRPFNKYRRWPKWMKPISLKVVQTGYLTFQSPVDTPQKFDLGVSTTMLSPNQSALFSAYQQWKYTGAKLELLGLNNTFSGNIENSDETGGAVAHNKISYGVNWCSDTSDIYSIDTLRELPNTHWVKGNNYKGYRRIYPKCYVQIPKDSNDGSSNGNQLVSLKRSTWMSCNQLDALLGRIYVVPRGPLESEQELSGSADKTVIKSFKQSFQWILTHYVKLQKIAIG